jgi:hypothetical protein
MNKLQTLHAAFNEKNESGEYKTWTIQELMERTGGVEQVTIALISILRAPAERFKMRIVKIGNTYQYRPLPTLDGLTNGDKVSLLVKLMKEVGIWDVVMNDNSELSGVVDMIAEEYKNKGN